MDLAEVLLSVVLEKGVSFTACFYLAMSLVPSLPSFKLISCSLNKVLYFRHAKEADTGRAEVLLLSHFWKSTPLEFILRYKSQRTKTTGVWKDTGKEIPNTPNIHQCVSTNYLLSAGVSGCQTLTSSEYKGYRIHYYIAGQAVLNPLPWFWH